MISAKSHFQRRRDMLKAFAESMSKDAAFTSKDVDVRYCLMGARG